jgi:hypothetical protein
MCDDETKALLQGIFDLLQGIFEQGNYDYSDPMTVGGGTGTYILASPWNEQCEWALLLASSGSSGAGVGSFVISPRQQVSALHNDGTDSLGLLSNGRTSNALPAIAAQMGNNTNVPYSPVWVPLIGNTALYVTISAAASTTVTVTVIFRRSKAAMKFEHRHQSPHGSHRMYGRAERAAMRQTNLGIVEEVNRNERTGRTKIRGIF